MIEFQEQIPLGPLVNYRIGGPARYYYQAKTAEDVKGAVIKAKSMRLSMFILGAGTNILIDDRGFDGLVLHVAITDMKFINNETVTVGSGVLMKDLLEATVEHELAGLEWAGGLPGTLGGAVRGNAGAFGGEIKDSIIEVESLNTRTGKIEVRDNKGCKFAYRSSIYKEKRGKEIVLNAQFQLQRGRKEAIQALIEEKIAYRNLRHPVEYPNIGSIFKNVPLETVKNEIQAFEAATGAKVPVKNDPFLVVPSAYLISETGIKGTTHGGAMVSPKHPNFIINSNGATAGDVKILIEKVTEAVEEKFKIHLEEEVERVFFRI